MVQLSALLCLVPLALENTYLQARPPCKLWCPFCKAPAPLLQALLQLSRFLSW